MEGIEKVVDELGRVVLPAKFRHALGLGARAKVVLTLANGEIAVTPAERSCLLCGRVADLHPSFRLCPDCITRIKAE